MEFAGNVLRTSTPSISFSRLYGATAVADLQREVISLLANEWIDHVNKNDYSGGWDLLPLRCQRQFLNAHPVLQGFSIATGDDWENMPILAQCPQIQSIFNRLLCPLKAARLMRLKAGAHIKPHRDHGLAMEFGEARLHVPILTGDAVSFMVDHKKIPMKPGEIWYFNADQTHEVHNYGAEDRINLVIDCVVNDWLHAKILAGTANE
jgi:hypothetical protein